jgi:hypothetical protein
MVLEALLRDGGELATLMADRTLEAMARGGIYDQIGAVSPATALTPAGWCRISRRCCTTMPCSWGVHALVAAYRDPLAERVVDETVAWLLREMRTEQGAFAASLDADSNDDHGQCARAPITYGTVINFAARSGERRDLGG